MSLTSRSSIFVAFVVLSLFMLAVVSFSNLPDLFHRQSHGRLSLSNHVVKYFNQTKAAEIQHQRRTRVHSVCEKIMGLESIDILKDQLRFTEQGYEQVWLRLAYFVDDRKLAFFLVLKAGFSNWLKFISSIMTEGEAKLRPSKGLPFTLDEIRPKLRTYKKIIFVRNPISRLVSGYVDKFVDLPSEYYVNMSRRIIEKVRGEAIPESERPDLTFPEFLHHIFASELYMDPHWKPIHEQKVPCDIDYDFIGKLETVYRDVDYLKSLYNIKKNVVYGESYNSNTKRAEVMLNYYRDLPKETVEKVIQKYKYDFLIFGYPLPKDASNIVEYIRNVKADDFHIPSD